MKHVYEVKRSSAAVIKLTSIIHLFTLTGLRIPVAPATPAKHLVTAFIRSLIDGCQTTANPVGVRDRRGSRQESVPMGGDACEDYVTSGFIIGGQCSHMRRRDYVRSTTSAVYLCVCQLMKRLIQLSAAVALSSQPPADRDIQRRTWRPSLKERRYYY